MKRDIRIDALRGLAILLIMLAHTRPPQWLYELRDFDVVLMTFILGASYCLSRERKKTKPYLLYLKERFMRLVIPAWTFLSLFFLLLFIFVITTKQTFPFSFKSVLTSYSLTWGIGYIWIIRVFFIIAILSPLLYWLANKAVSPSEKLSIIGICLLLQAGLDVLSANLTGISHTIFEQYIAISFAYALAALIGIWAVRQSKKENLILFSFFLALFFILAIYQNLPSIEGNKYPPTAYFISYGLAGSLLLFWLTSIRVIEQFLQKIPGIYWLSQHSLELYYWHLFPIMYLNLFVENDPWYLRFLIAFPIAFILTILQSQFIPHFFNPKKALKSN
ncbi:acyltransferase [Tetragenococcus halophilus]|uniref:acyltransferase family protein n=1 Tax=Tetragenococcus halophilus TaxID=51669 RepID=UPI001F1E938C|nr:acyltransferase [Tetragenococcus halophilus]MCF1685101.1 acyltransferase [Tetragenococcus halophilus]